MAANENDSGIDARNQVIGIKQIAKSWLFFITVFCLTSCGIQSLGISQQTLSVGMLKAAKNTVGCICFKPSRETAPSIVSHTAVRKTSMITTGKGLDKLGRVLSWCAVGLIRMAAIRTAIAAILKALGRS